MSAKIESVERTAYGTIELRMSGVSEMEDRNVRIEVDSEDPGNRRTVHSASSITRIAGLSRTPVVVTVHVNGVRHTAPEGGGDDSTESGPAVPDESWVKEDIKTYLDGHAIEYPARASKSELLELVR